jgi:hypothetical protein
MPLAETNHDETNHDEPNHDEPNNDEPNRVDDTISLDNTISLDETNLDETNHEAQHRAAPNAVRSPMSRRTLIKAAAGGGIVVAAGGAIGFSRIGVSAEHPESNAAASIAPAASAPLAAPTRLTGPPLINVTNAGTGALEVFSNGSRAQIHDHDLAKRIVKVGTTGPVVVQVVDEHAGTLDVFGSDTRTQIRDRDLAGRIVRAV